MLISQVMVQPSHRTKEASKASPSSGDQQPPERDLQIWFGVACPAIREL
jgi:hypothetical protein